VPSNDEELKSAMGDWLGQLAPWDVFSTWTFGGPPSKSDAPIWGQRLSRKSGAFGRWHGISTQGALYWGRRHLQWLENAAAQRVYGFLGVERGKTGGLVHLHALLGNVSHLKAFCGEKLPPGHWGRGCCMVHAWPCGYARVLPYDPKRGARHYVSKYIAKRLSEWELVGFPAVPQSLLPMN
jgi:hypothetical protein